MDQGGQEAILIVRPPALFTEKGYMPPDVFFVPQRAVYGLRRSPRLWGTCRDETMEGFQNEAQDAKEQVRRFHLQALRSEPNLWGLVMTYVDDIFICSSQPILEAIKNKFQELYRRHQRQNMSPNIPFVFWGWKFQRRRLKMGKERSGM